MGTPFHGEVPDYADLAITRPEPLELRECDGAVCIVDARGQLVATLPVPDALPLGRALVATRLAVWSNDLEVSDRDEVAGLQEEVRQLEQNVDGLEGDVDDAETARDEARAERDKATERLEGALAALKSIAELAPVGSSIGAATALARLALTEYGGGADSKPIPPAWAENLKAFVTAKPEAGRG